MTRPVACPRCGTPRPIDAPGGLCPGCLLRIAAERDPLSDHQGPETIATIGDYKLIRELGRGGMGVVFLARQVSRNRVVAVKLVRAGRLASEVERHRFLAEAEATGRLDHPNIITLFETGELDGEPFFSMQYVEGGDLDRHQARLRRDPRSAARLIATAAQAVDHAHGIGVIHRDLKPANILVGPDGEPIVCDFGIARLIESKAGRDGLGVVIGSPGTMAPEQAAGRPDRVRPSTDVYGLGATFYQVLTGRPPLLARTVAATLRRIIDEAPRPPSAWNRAVDPDLDAILLRCLAKEPRRRFSSAKALADRLEGWLDERG